MNLAVQAGIFIDADDFRALLTSVDTESLVVTGDDQTNPIDYLKRMFNR